jgi:hypothetical protein
VRVLREVKSAGANLQERKIETTPLMGYFNQDYLSIFSHLSYDSAGKTQSVALLQFSNPCNVR